MSLAKFRKIYKGNEEEDQDQKDVTITPDPLITQPLKVNEDK